MLCRGRGSNPHAPFGTRDFKSRASASSATPACGERTNRISELRGLLRGRAACFARFVHGFCPCDAFFQRPGGTSQLKTSRCVFQSPLACRFQITMYLPTLSTLPSGAVVVKAPTSYAQSPLSFTSRTST
jgi:hypothetical protein